MYSHYTASPDVISRFEDRLDDVQRSDLDGPSFTCLCPNHDDNQRSLNVTFTPDGTALLHCFAGCKTEDVLKCIGLEKRDLYPRPSDGVTVRMLSTLRQLPKEWLREQGLAESDDNPEYPPSVVFK